MRGLVVIALVLSGCIGPGDDGSDNEEGEAPLMPAWRADPCDPGDATPSGNMPATAPFDGPMEDLIERFEEAFDVQVPEEPAEVFEGSHRYDLADGTLRIDLVEEGSDQRVPFVSWSHPNAWPGPVEGAAARLADALRDLGFPAVTVGEAQGSTVYRVDATQTTAAGTHLVASALFHPSRHAEPGWYSSLEVYPAHRDGATASVGLQQARDVASAFLACKDGRADFPEGPFTPREDGGKAILHESLAWQLVYDGKRDPDHHCGGVGAFVNVDASTGAVLGWSWLPCE